MAKPFQENIDRYQGMLDELETSRQPTQITPSIQEGIIQTESAGDPAAVGDIGATAGSSRGLMQIQAETAKGLYNRNLLPKMWHGKKVKKRDLPELLMDPDFNKQAGSALYEDNKNIIKRKAKQKGVKLSEEQLDDLTIKAHNQGVTKTLRRDLLQEEALNPRVQQYLEKVRGRMGQQNFQEGGLRDPFAIPADIVPPAAQTQDLSPGAFTLDPEVYQPPSAFDYDYDEPTPVEVTPTPAAPTQAVPTDFQSMMAEFSKKEKKYEEDKRRANIADFASQAISAFGEYGVRRGAAKAQIAGGVPIAAPKINIPTTQLAKGLKQPDLKEYVQKIKMMKELAALKTGGKAGSTDPNSKASKTARKKAEFLTGRTFPGSFTEADITGIIKPLARKIESGHQIKRLGQAEARIGLAKTNTQISKDRLLLSNKKHGYTISEDDERDALTYQKMATDDKTYKYGIDIKNDIDIARDVLERAMAGEATALKTLGVKLAKAFGEKGALSESDVTRYIQDPSILGWIKSKGAEYKNAKITPEVHKSIQNILNDMDKNAITKINEAYVRTATKFSRSRKKTSPMALKKALFLVNPNYQPVDIDALSTQAKTYTKEQLKKAADKSFGGDLERTKQYYESKGYRSK